MNYEKTFHCSNKHISRKLFFISALVAFKFILNVPNEFWFSWVLFVVGFIITVALVASLILGFELFLKIDENNFEWRSGFGKKVIPIADVYKATLTYPGDDVVLTLFVRGGRTERIMDLCFFPKYTELVEHLNAMEERREGFYFDNFTVKGKWWITPSATPVVFKNSDSDH